MTLRTRLTEKLGIAHPILLAPMGGVAGAVQDLGPRYPANSDWQGWKQDMELGITASGVVHYHAGISQDHGWPSLACFLS